MKTVLVPGKHLLSFLFAVSVLSGCATSMRVPEEAAGAADGAAAGVSAEAALQAWSEVLEKYVDTLGRTNFQALSKNPGELHRYVRFIARTDPGPFFKTEADRLAHYLNSYNALAMYDVLESELPESFGGFKKLSIFVLHDFDYGGRYLSLWDLENRIIRPLGDERIHFALNCMVRGCPRLPRKPFTGAHLHDELDREASLFFNEIRNVELHPDQKLVRFSQILEFYTKDFLARAPSLVAYANRYRVDKIPEDYRVEFIPYDWTVNQQP